MKTLYRIWRHSMFVLGLISIPFFANAQDENPQDYSVNVAYDKMNVAPPPETWMFMKYGGQRPSLYTGTVKADIPIYTYKDKDFEIPISLTYASNGLLPNVQASSVGLGWMLQAGGGFIMQEVNGVLDDGGAGNVSGYSSYIKNLDPLDRSLMARISLYYDLPFPAISSDPNNDEAGPYYETTPDIFTFNFCGHSGKFLTTHAGTHIFNTNHPSGEYKIDFLRNRITITTGDGYKYKFQISGESSISTNTLNNHNSHNDNRKWNLHQIMAPNGRTVEFNYILEGFENRRGAGFSSIFYETYTAGFWHVRGESFEPVNSLSSAKSLMYYPYIVSSSGTISLISTITIDNQTHIEFQYSARKYQEEGWSSDGSGPGDPGALNNNSRGFTTLATPKKLDGIKVRSRIGSGPEYILKKCTLEYDYGLSSGNQIMLLKNVSLSGIGSYQMDYYNSQNPFPYHGTPAIDHWGYYNGQESNHLLSAIPDPYFDGLIACFRSDSRDPHSEFAIQGMLKKLVYPTGGHSIFNYEDHTFSEATIGGQYLSKNFNTDNYRVNSTTWRTGGLRIHNITDYSATGQRLKWIDYAYTDYLGYNAGILTCFPIYIQNYRIPGWASAQRMRQQAADYQFTNNDVNEILGYHASKTHIEYSSVREINSDGSYTVYSFTNSSSASVPDDDVPGAYYYKHNYCEAPEVTLPISLESQRGKLVWVEHYDNTGHIKSRTENLYDYSKELSYVVQAKFAPFNAYEHWIYTDDYPLEKTVSTTFSGNNRISSVINYRYNDKNQLSESTTVNSKQDSIRIRNIYAHEMAPGIVRDSILEQNLLALPWKTIKTVREQSGVEKTVDAALYSYKLASGKIVPAAIASAGNLPLSAAIEPTYKTETSFDIYDDFGNLVQTTDKTGKTNSYVWGYGGMYVLAKIEDVTIDQIINRGFPTLLTRLIPGELNTAQRQAATWWGRTTLYEYKPLIGITKITDPYGITTSYTYNSDNKLYQIKDHDGNIIKQYNYSTDNQ
jgi:hypothetical protein